MPHGPRPSTPTERGDTDLEGTSSSLARQNAATTPTAGQRDDASPDHAPSPTEPRRLRGVADKRD